MAYFNKTLSENERNYCVTRREIPTIMKTLEYFHKCLNRQEFYFFTDHSALTWLLCFKNLEGYAARWGQRHQEYNFMSEHRQGRSTTTHSLSRKNMYRQMR